MTEKATKTTKTTKTVTMTTRAAAEEGVLDDRLQDLHASRWPSALRVRYVGDQPVSGPTELVDLLTVDEVEDR